MCAPGVHGGSERRSTSARTRPTTPFAFNSLSMTSISISNSWPCDPMRANSPRAPATTSVMPVPFEVPEVRQRSALPAADDRQPCWASSSARCHHLLSVRVEETTLAADRARKKDIGPLDGSLAIPHRPSVRCARWVCRICKRSHSVAARMGAQPPTKSKGSALLPTLARLLDRVRRQLPPHGPHPALAGGRPVVPR